MNIRQIALVILNELSYEDTKRLYKYLREDLTQDLQKMADLPIEQFVSQFKNVASDSKVKAILRAGLKDGKPDDEKNSFNLKTLSVDRLHPTQNEIGFNQSLLAILKQYKSFPNVDKGGSLDKILQGDAVQIGEPIVTLNSEFIIDGHHRWSQTYVANPDATMKCIDLKMPDMKPEDVLKVMHMAIASIVGSLPLAEAKGTNLLTANETEVKEFIIENLEDKALALYKEHKQLNTKEEVADYIWKNVKQMQTHNEPSSDAPSRNYMPQTDDAEGWADALAKGVVNYIEPKEDDAEETK